MIGRRVRHLKRYRQIARILIRNGFGSLIQGVGLTDLLAIPSRWFAGSTPVTPLSTFERIRKTVEELGPTFIKIGQVGSLRPDLLPPGLVKEFEKLQDRVPPFEFADVERIVEEELGEPLDELFAAFDKESLAAASIGQVHKAKLHNGRVVAVKVQRPGIAQNIQTDLEILADFAQLAERRLDWASHYELSEVVDEFSRALRAELDYTVEARNADRIRRRFKGDDTVVIPEVLWELTTPRVMVMEYVEGIKLSDLHGLEKAGFNRSVLAERALNAVFEQVFMHGFFHADPHPGNLAALPEHKILIMDFGLVGRLTDDMKSRLSSLIIGLMRKNTDAILRSLVRMGIVPVDVKMDKLRRDIDDLREKYYEIPMSELNMAESVNDLFTVAYRHRIRIPSDLTLVGKTLLTIEGVVETLDPEFSIMDAAEPFGRQLVRQQLQPKNLLDEVTTHFEDFAEPFVDLPKQVQLLAQTLNRGQFQTQLKLGDLEGLTRRMDRMSNRLSLSVVLLSVSIFLSGFLVASAIKPPGITVFHMPVTDLGLVLGVLFLFWIVWAILRSGRM